VSGTRKLVLTALSFVLAAVAVVAASVTHRAYPLFVAWVPLVVVPWILALPDPGAEPPEYPDGGHEQQA
jgi:hypothetical protein